MPSWTSCAGAVAAGGYLVIAEGVPDLGLAWTYPEMRAMWQAVT
jgi:hypothetical protein